MTPRYKTLLPETLLEDGTHHTRRDLKSFADELRISFGSSRRILVVTASPRVVAASIAAAVAAEDAVLLLRPDQALVEFAQERFRPHVVLTDSGLEDGVADDAHGGGTELLLATSGTTGTPKLVRHDLAALAGRVHRLEDRSARWLLTYAPTSFAGLQVLLTAAAWRAALIATTARTIKAVADEAFDAKATHVSGTPTFWRSLLSYLGLDAATLPLKQITIGGEVADQVILDRLRDTFPSARISHVYASTEAGAVFAVKDGRAGFPAEWLAHGTADVRVRVADGILEVSSPRRMVGYYGGAPVASDWVRTGDRVETHGDRVVFVGRDDAVINVGGSKVQPERVESVLLEVPGVEDVHVRGKPSSIVGEVVVAEVVADRSSTEDDLRQAIFDHARRRLDRAAVPRILEFVPRLEQSASGKKVRR